MYREREDETPLYIFLHVLLLRHGTICDTHRVGRNTRLVKQFHEIRLAIASSGSMLGRPGAGPKMYPQIRLNQTRDQLRGLWVAPFHKVECAGLLLGWGFDMVCRIVWSTCLQLSLSSVFEFSFRTCLGEVVSATCVGTATDNPNICSERAMLSALGKCPNQVRCPCGLQK